MDKPTDEKRKELVDRIYAARTTEQLADLMHVLYNVEKIDPYWWIPVCQALHGSTWMDARQMMIEKMNKA